ncbi:MAG: hypothetical protein ABIZ82_05285 [Candidatus Tumulicola sp.]
MIPTNCSLYKDAHETAGRAGVPAAFRSIGAATTFLPAEVFGSHLDGFLFGGNRVATVLGRIQSGKTCVLSMLMMRCILLNRIFENMRGVRRPNRFSFVSNGQLFRSLRSVGEEGNYAARLLYDIENLAIDNVDKVEPSVRSLIREIIVYRTDHGRNTLLSVTEAATLRDFDPQVRRRIEDGRQIKLGSTALTGVHAGLALPAAFSSMIATTT